MKEREELMREREELERKKEKGGVRFQAEQRHSLLTKAKGN